MSVSADAVAKAQPHPREIDIKVNRKAVVILGPDVTGLQIKEAAIAAALPIELSFQLSERLPNRETRIIGDNEVVKVHEGSEFVAVAGDDNS